MSVALVGSTVKRGTNGPQLVSWPKSLTLTYRVLFSKTLSQIQSLQQRLLQPPAPALASRIRTELEDLQAKCSQLDLDLAEIQQRVEARHELIDEKANKATEPSGAQKLANESHRDFLIRTGKITPFSRVSDKWQRTGSTLQDVILDAEESGEDLEDDADEPQVEEPKSHQYLSQPGFAPEDESGDGAVVPEEKPSPKRRKLVKKSLEAVKGNPKVHSEGGEVAWQGTPARDGDSEGQSNSLESGLSSGQASVNGKRRKRAGSSKSQPATVKKGASAQQDLKDVDDGNEKLYQARLNTWADKRRGARSKALLECQKAEQVRVANGGNVELEEEAVEDVVANGGNVELEEEAVEDMVANGGNVELEEEAVEDMDGDEWLLPHPTKPDTVFEGGLRLPGDIYSSLFDYQKTGVQWLWELYQQRVGGIIGDEMGLGKTIQVISFLAGLHHSGKLNKPVIVVAPATVMKQWVNEFHRWWPPLRVSILHSSGSGMLNLGSEESIERDLETTGKPINDKKTKAQSSAAKVVKTVLEKGHVLVTTYAGLQTYGSMLIPIDWGYAVLDEGHKIRNPNTAITIYCKEIRTPNRVILSGTPMQNNLTELWSLFDFITPMRLGTLVNFRNQFEIPIKLGGYANASNLQVQTALRCAETLRDAIRPFLLQRLKADVASDLPRKSEQVLFCKLAKSQRLAYKDYLESDDVRAILDGAKKSFAGIETLRKICNHPDLVDRQILMKKEGYEYGSPTKSGKMQVVKALLQLWKKGGHKTLLFAQQKIVLNILETFIKSFEDFKYRRMDGGTPIEHRQGLVDEFNRSPEIDVFLLTTKVGGLGINLTGADRVIIFDPDWNPSTDTQARERAWRLGQKREVTIYRLMTAGTIEEKIYHRQLFKQFLANKILKDPKQRQTLPMKDLRDLFTLGSENGGETETGQLFKGTEIDMNGRAMGYRGDTEHPEVGEAFGTSDTDDDRNLGAITGIAGLEDLVDPIEGEVQHDGAEDRLMAGILAGSGVSSALEHDEIVNGKKNVLRADPKIIEEQAKMYAASAARGLQKAQEAARNIPIGTPTWTGQAGVAGRPDPMANRRRRVVTPALSSSELLARLRARQSTPSGETAGVERGRSTAQGFQRDLMERVRLYMMAHGGVVRSQMLVDHFNHLCKTQQQVDLFKAGLGKLADLTKGGRMRGTWTLKDEHRH